MKRRTLIGILGLLAVAAANGAMWWVNRDPEASPPDPREVIRDQMSSEWEDLDATRVADARLLLAPALRVTEAAEDRRNARGFGRTLALGSLPKSARADLVEAVVGAVEAITAPEPDRLVKYMERRGMQLDPAKLANLRPAHTTAPDRRAAPPERFAMIWRARQVDPHWEAVVIGATAINAWRPASMRHHSMIHLGRNESWVWGNEVVFPSAFSSAVSYEQASRDQPAMLADVRILIDHDQQLAGQRSPYFLRFWYSEGREQWVPTALKLVRTSDPEAPAPVIFF